MESQMITDMTAMEDETNILLNHDTVEAYELDSDPRSGSDSTDMSFAIEPGRTRRYHRCFKVNILLNISMLVIFVCLISFGPWYTMTYDNATTSFYAEFSLLLLYTESIDKSTDITTYKRYLAIDFGDNCKDCKKDPSGSGCDDILSFCDSDNITRARVYIWLVSRTAYFLRISLRYSASVALILVFLLAIRLRSDCHNPAHLCNNLRHWNPEQVQNKVLPSFVPTKKHICAPLGHIRSSSGVPLYLDVQSRLHSVQVFLELYFMGVLGPLACPVPHSNPLLVLQQPFKEDQIASVRWK